MHEPIFSPMTPGVEAAFRHQYGIPVGLTFEQMVHDLFKRMPGTFGSGMHAAVGLSGEVGEILDSDMRIELLLEFGDAEFYLMALKQMGGFQDPTESTWSDQSFPIGLLPHLMTVCAAEILDLAKKPWVYEGKVMVAKLTDRICKMEAMFETYYRFLNTTQQTVRLMNMAKLVGKTGRYATGKYSDEQANGRADAAPGGNANV